MRFIELTYRKDRAGKEKKFTLNPDFIVTMTEYVNEGQASTKLILSTEMRVTTEVEESIAEILVKIKQECILELMDRVKGA